MSQLCAEKIKHVIIILALFLVSDVSGKTCPGKCMKDTAACTAKGGKIVGYCIDESACCDLSAKKIGSCGDKKEGLHSAIFQSPEYPSYFKGDLICQFKFVLESDYDGIIVEFVDAYMEGNGFAPHSPCEADNIFLQGFKGWAPSPRCGNLTGYVFVIDKSSVTEGMQALTILAVMTSNLYRWKIKVSHLSIAKSQKDITGGTELTNDPLANFESSQENPESGMDLLDPLVVNGKDTLISEVPWQASLRQFITPRRVRVTNTNMSLPDYDNYNREKAGCEIEGKHFCGGSIISSQHILTASHCLYHHSKLIGMRSLAEMRVFLGETDLCLNDEVKYGHPTQNYTIDKVMMHYAYDDDNMAMNDVLVIKLKEKIKFTDYIKPIALSKRKMKYTGKEVKVSGWGLTNLTIPLETAKLPLILQSTDGIYVQNDTFCHTHLARGFVGSRPRIELYPKYKTAFNSVLCTEAATNDTVDKLVGQGDSGGPLILKEEGQQPIQVGIVSYGLAVYLAKHLHDNSFVDFYQDVSFYRDWIDLAMAA